MICAVCPVWRVTEALWTAVICLTTATCQEIGIHHLQRPTYHAEGGTTWSSLAPVMQHGKTKQKRASCHKDLLLFLPLTFAVRLWTNDTLNSYKNRTAIRPRNLHFSALLIMALNECLQRWTACTVTLESEHKLQRLLWCKNMAHLSWMRKMRSYHLVSIMIKIKKKHLLKKQNI